MVTLKEAKENGTLPGGGARQVHTHLGGSKRLQSVVEDYVLTMQHALRQNLHAELIARAKDEAGVLPELTAAEMFDYLVDSDPEFYNWCFPFCAVVLTRQNIGYLHQAILQQFRASLEPVKTS